MAIYKILHATLLNRMTELGSPSIWKRENHNFLHQSRRHEEEFAPYDT